MTPGVDPIPGHETIDGETLFLNDIAKLRKENKEKDEQIKNCEEYYQTYLKDKDALIAEKDRILAHYRIGIDDLVNALRPHADAGDVKAGNVVAALLSIKRTVNKPPKN